MRLRSLGAALTFGSAIIFYSQLCDAAALGKQPYVSQSSHIVIAVTGSSLQRNQIHVHFLIRNDNKFRIYVRDARSDQSQYAFLGSGARLYPPSVVSGISDDCGSVQNCMGVLGARDLSSYSYIEPGDSLPFSLQYQSNDPVQQQDTISFSVALVAMFAQPDNDAVVGSMKAIRFPFSAIPIAQ